MRASKTLLLILLSSLGCLALAKRCPAQELRRYQPSTPTVSAYTNLGRFSGGGLPNYYSLVRPQNRQKQVNLQTQRFQRQQTATLQQLQRVVPVPLAPQATTGTASQFLTTGSRAVYRETLQFYPPVSLRR